MTADTTPAAPTEAEIRAEVEGAWERIETLLADASVEALSVKGDNTSSPQERWLADAILALVGAISTLKDRPS